MSNVDRWGTQSSSTKKPPKLNDVVPYKDKIENRRNLGQNPQKDHIIAQGKNRLIRGKDYKPGKDPAVVVETGKATSTAPPKPHTQKTFHDPQSDVAEIKRLKAGGFKSYTEDVVEPSRQAALRSGYEPESVDTAIWGQMDEAHSSESLQQTGKKIRSLEASKVSVRRGTQGGFFEPPNMRTVAKTAEGAAVILTLGAEPTPEKTDETLLVGAVTTGGTMIVAKVVRTNPEVALVAGAAVAGGFLGYVAEKELSVSDFSAAHGKRAEDVARTVGASDSVATAVGVTATIVTSAAALKEAAIAAKVGKWLMKQ